MSSVLAHRGTQKSSNFYHSGRCCFQARLIVPPKGGLIDPRMRASNDHVVLLQCKYDWQAWGFREQEDDQAALLTLACAVREHRGSNHAALDSPPSILLLCFQN